MGTLKKVKQYRLHYEGTPTLVISTVILLLVGALCWWAFADHYPVVLITLGIIAVIFYAIVVNFFRCPIRIFEGDNDDSVVVAPADGRVVVIEEVNEDEYLHQRCLMISVFMSVTNVHANWFPVQGLVTYVRHHAGNFMRAWLPKASTENERSTIVIRTPSGHDVLVRQVAGAVARRIVTYATEGQECYLDNFLGFIKFGSRVDVYLPLESTINVKMGQRTVGNNTIIAHLPK